MVPLYNDAFIDISNASFLFWLHKAFWKHPMLCHDRAVMGRKSLRGAYCASKCKEWNLMKRKKYRIAKKYIFASVLFLESWRYFIYYLFTVYYKQQSKIYQIRSSRTKLNTFQCLNMSAILSGLRYKDTQYLFKQGCLNFFF